MTMDIRIAAKMEYKERMKQKLAETPLPLEVLIMQGEPIKQEHLDALKKVPTYLNRERIPEPLLWYADLYNKLTGQEPAKMEISDWIDTFEFWKIKGLQDADIRGAWAQAQSDKNGFTVGRPGALTVTAVGIKSKSKPALPVTNKEGIEKTKQLLSDKYDDKKFVPRPANMARPKGI